MRRTALRFLLCVGGGMFVETGVHPDRPARDRAGKVKVDSVFQHLNKLQKHRQRQQGQFVRQHPRRHRMGLRQGVEHPSRRMPPVGPGHLKDMVERREVLIPGEHPQPHEVADPNDPDARPWMGLTAKGVQDLAHYDNDEDDW